MANGDFVAVTHWPTMWDKMTRANSAQAENDRIFYQEHIPDDTEVLIRVTRRKVVVNELGKKRLGSHCSWYQADGLIAFKNDFTEVELTAEGVTVTEQE